MSEDQAIQTAITITGLSQQRECSPSLHEDLVCVDWSYSAEIEIEISGAGQTVTHKIDLPLEKWQRDAIWEARIRTHELLSARLEEMMDTIQRALGEKCLTHGIECAERNQNEN